MKCRDAKQEMALQLGHDGPDRSRWEEVRRHVAGCPDCRTHYGRLKEALGALELARTQASTYEVRGSLWPELESRLANPAPTRKRPGRDGWIPLASVAVACLLFVTVWTGWGSHHSESPTTQPAVPRQTIGGFPDFSSKRPEPSREAREAEERARAQLHEVHKDL